MIIRYRLSKIPGCGLPSADQPPLAAYKLLITYELDESGDRLNFVQHRFLVLVTSKDSAKPPDD